MPVLQFLVLENGKRRLVGLDTDSLGGVVDQEVYLFDGCTPLYDHDLSTGFVDRLKESG